MNKHEAIYKTNPTVVTIRGDEAFDAEGNAVIYDEAAVQAYIDAHAYIAKRQVEYPPMTDQLDMLWHAIDSGSLDKDSDFYKSLKAVKDANPKG